MTTKTEIAERVKKVLTDHHMLEARQLKDDAHFVDDLGFDSLDIVDFSMTLEDEFDIEIPDDQVETLKTLGDAIGYLCRRLDAEEAETCIACAEPMLDGQPFYPDVSGGVLHAACAGRDREGFVKDLDSEEPLGAGDPIPEPQTYESDAVLRARLASQKALA